MLGNVPKFVAFLAILSVAPASASQRTTNHPSSCPYERGGEAAAAAAATRAATPPVKVETTITLSDRLRALDGWFAA